MKLVGQTIKHKTFGNGTVTELVDNVVTICFPRGEKKFIYPDAFSKFLVIKDVKMQHAINEVLDRKRQEEEAQRQAMQEAQERIRRIRNMKITPNSQAVFHITEDTKKQVLTTWKVSTGYYLSGNAKGEYRIPDRLKPNSACILTECGKDEPESKRRIIGVFMVKDDFFGDLCVDGEIESHTKYKLALSHNESLLFWDYFEGGNPTPRWGNTAFKYFSNKVMERILFDIREALVGSENEEIALKFYQYFCRINGLSARPTELGDEE